MKLSAEARGALRRYGHLAPIVGLSGTCAGIATAFRLTGHAAQSDAVVPGLSLSVTVVATILLSVLAVAGCFLYERARTT